MAALDECLYHFFFFWKKIPARFANGLILEESTPLQGLDGSLVTSSITVGTCPTVCGRASRGLNPIKTQSSSKVLLEMAPVRFAR